MLYIIGNGFDLHHGVRSSYTEFGQYVKSVKSDLYDTFERYFSFDGNWADLEGTLAHLDVDSIIDDASDFLQSYGADGWSDAFHHDYQDEVERIVDALSSRLKSIFTDWVLGLQIPDKESCPVALLNLDRSSIYLSFNYTDTLQRLYRIAPENVVHIHGSVSLDKPNLVLGHAVVPSGIRSLNCGADLQEQDTRVTEANEIIDGYFSTTFKPTDNIIATHREFFSSLTEVKQIFVLGHSLSEVDIPYFEEIVRQTCKLNPKWTVTYYSESSVPNIEKAILGLGVLKSNLECVRIGSV